MVVLCLILAGSLFLRVWALEKPCESQCATPAQHTLIGDEAYYVSAAQIIDHINPPARHDYHDAPFGKDPNAEHPQLATAIIAVAIEIFGDNPLGWRLPSVLFGMIALAALYWLVRGAGGSRWLAVGVTGVASLDNLMLVQSRIGTLDIFLLAMMLIAGGLYVRGRPLAAGVAMGVGMCMKEAGIYMLLVFALFEALRFLRAWWVDEDAGAWVRDNLLPSGVAIFSTAVTFLLLLWILDLIVPGYDTGTKITYAGSPFTHFFHIVNYASELRAHPGEPGIASTPFEWLLNEKAIPYAKTVVEVKAGDKVISSHTPYFFQGLMNPFIIFLAVPAMIACVSRWWRTGDRLALLAVAWFVGTFAPAVFESYALNRISYLYYMLIIMPAIYVAVAYLFAHPHVPRIVTAAWAAMLVFSFADLYPIRDLLPHQAPLTIVAILLGVVFLDLAVFAIMYAVLKGPAERLQAHSGGG